jgi:uncharacterized protein
MQGLNRRQVLAAVALASAGFKTQAAAPQATFAAAWATPQGEWRIGTLAPRNGALAQRTALEVPTRAHGLLWHDGQLLAVARRPGDWLVRWKPGSSDPQWAWIEPDRAYNGHVIASRDGKLLYTTETNLETGAGLVGVRDARSMEKVGEWATGGMDPHELLLDADGTLIVANGGIPTLPETGRLKIGLDRMDASVVRIDTGSGERIGQWRLDDPRLSLRHIAWGEREGRRVLGIALQAEHDDAERKRSAPVLALFDGRALQAVSAPKTLAGYGGDIAFAAGRFAVSCPRANGVALYDGAGGWQGFVALEEACALASGAGALSVAGLQQSARLSPGSEPAYQGLALRLDNHWLALA